MNLYDTQQICCAKCGEFVGEIKFDIKIVYIVCENCQNLDLDNKNGLNQKNLHENESSTMKQSLTLVS